MTFQSAKGQDISQRMDDLPVTRLHLAAVGLCALGFAFELLEVGLGGALSAVFSSSPHSTSSTELGWLLASVYVGAIFGAPSLGWLADRHGQKLMLMAALLLLSLTSLAAALSSDVRWLILFRGLSGLFIGAYPPLMISYLTDILPPRRRGMLIFVATGIAFMGPPLGIFIIRWLTPVQPLGLDAWRWGFLVGSIGTAAIGLSMWLLPNSPRSLLARGRLARAELACQKFERSKAVITMEEPVVKAAEAVRQFGASNRQGKYSLMIVGALNFLSPWSTLTFPVLTGAILVQKGFKLSDTLLYVGVATFGPVIGSLFAAIVVDRIERRVAMAICSLLMVLSGFAFIVGGMPIVLMVASIAFGALAVIYLSTLSLYGAELFPTKTRSSSVAIAWAFNRAGAAAAPLILLPILANVGPVWMFSVMSAALLAGIALLVFVPKGIARMAVG